MRAADECLNELSPLEVCWLTRLSMACAFVHVVDEEDVRHARKPCDDAFSYWSSDECRQVCSGSYVGRNAPRQDNADLVAPVRIAVSLFLNFLEQKF